jgi:hypothetical protein
MGQKIIVDESIFVLAHRGNNSLHSQLMMFIEQSQKKDLDRKYDLYMTPLSRKRLGMYRWYQIKCYIRAFFCEESIKQAIRKRAWRRRIAKKLIVGFKKSSFMETFFQSQLMNIFMYVNEAKSQYLEENEQRSIIPEEIIPLEVCATAQIAHRTGLPILSFNSDYRFFCLLPILPKAYITYLYPETFLNHSVQSH